MLYFNRIDVSEGIALINSFLHTPLSINSLHSYLHFYHSNVVYHYKQVSCHSMCLVSLVLDIKLKTLTFKFLTTSVTHDFPCGLLILLQLPLQELVLILKDKNTGSSPLTLTVCGLTLRSWLFIEIQLKELTLVKT